MSEPLQCGVYEHYKGRRYLVLGTAQHSETGEEFVVYVPLYEHGGSAMWVRPAGMFAEEIETDGGKTRPRFRFIGEK